MTTPPEVAPLAPLTDAEVTDLARKVVTNVVFLANDPEVVRLSFMVIALAGPDQLPPNVGAVYEDWEKAGPRSINGLPCFFSAHFVPAESMQALWDEMQRMRVALGLEPFPERPEAADGQNEGHGDHGPGADLPDGR